MREIVIPGDERQYELAKLHVLGNNTTQQRSRTLLVPVNEAEQRAELDFFNATANEMGISECQRRINEVTGEYEFVAPDGYEFVITGKLIKWYKGDEFGSAPEYSEQYLADPPEKNHITNQEPFGDEFRGRTISIGVNHNPFNPLAPVKLDKFTNHFTRRPESKPYVRVAVKGVIDFEWTAVDGQTLPFDVEGRPRSMIIPRNVLSHEWYEADGEPHEIEISLVPIQTISEFQAEVPLGVWADDTKNFWRPSEGLGTMADYFASEGTNPGMKEYMIERAGGTEADLYAYYRRIGSPYLDDPLFRAKNLVTCYGFNGDLDRLVAEEIAKMPKENDQRVKEERIFSTVLGSTVLIYEVEKSKKRDDTEPF
ncbi:MAG: hypothetical protein Q7T41_00515 [Candidatus Saccharibacteria bacterium]|nr:hypothetical protein [Candidatus Saccharibacteria bacterium]